MGTALTTTETRDLSIFDVGNDFPRALQVAKVMASSSMVPTQYQGEKNIPNVIVAMELSNRIGVSPFMVMQNLHVIQGRPSWASPFLIAMIEQSGKFDPLRFDINGTGDGRGCTAWTTLRLTGERIDGPRVDIAMAKAEGWYSRNGSKWKTMPDVMLRYRAAAFFARLYAYDIVCGLQTADEVIDVDAVEVPAQQGASLAQELLGETSAILPDSEPGPITPVQAPEQERSEEPAAEAVVEPELLPSKEEKNDIWKVYLDVLGNNRPHAINASMIITNGRGFKEWTNTDLSNLRADIERRKAELVNEHKDKPKDSFDLLDAEADEPAPF